MYIRFAEIAGKNGFTVQVTCDRDGKMYGFKAVSHVPTEADAAEMAAKFPKSLKVRGSAITGKHVNGWVSFEASLLPNGITGVKNETSINRIVKFIALCEKLGLTLKFDDVHCLNQITDRAEFERQLNALK